MNYTFFHRITGKVKTIEMKMAEREEWLKKHRLWEQTFGVINVVDPVNIGITKPPTDFQKYILGPMREKVGRDSIIGKRRWDIPKEI